jgi:mono/diheme cytochrome c family protein
MKRQISILVVLLAVAGLVSLAVSAQTKKAPAKKATAAKPAGKGSAKGMDAAPLWKQYCQKCHAPDGKGIESLEPPDLTSEKWQTANDDKAVTEAINEGKGIMPGFKDSLKPAQVAALVKHIRSFGPAKADAEKK